MGNKFAEVERKYRNLLLAYEEGSLDAEPFAHALADLMFHDDQDQWWQIQGNGKWLRYNGEAWEEATPPKPSPPPPPRSALIPPPRRSHIPPEVPTQEPALVSQPEAPKPHPISLGSGSHRPPVAAPAPTPPIVLTPSSPPLATDSATSPSLTCPNCHRKIVAGSHFCKYCGTKPAEAPAPPPPIQSPPTPTCPECHEPLLPNAKFCGKCGHAMAVPVCPKCQLPTLPGAHFCKGCGQKLS